MGHYGEGDSSPSGYGMEREGRGRLCVEPALGRGNHEKVECRMFFWLIFRWKPRMPHKIPIHSHVCNAVSKATVRYSTLYSNNCCHDSFNAV